MDSREKLGYRYKPNPLNTSMVQLSPDVLELSELIAANCHDVWAKSRIDQGWRWGPQRDNHKKLHPDLIPCVMGATAWSQPRDSQCRCLRVSLCLCGWLVWLWVWVWVCACLCVWLCVGGSHRYDQLTEETKQYDRNTAYESLKAIVTFGFKLKRVRGNNTGDHQFGTAAPPGETYTPRPVDTGHIELSSTVSQLAELLAANTHDVWAKGRMDQGWKFGPRRDDKKKLHNCLVPYAFLTNTVRGVLGGACCGGLVVLL